ncbi:MAG: hypothetical protein R2795_02990 [Saprospiraceae bacterium]
MKSTGYFFLALVLTLPVLVLSSCTDEDETRSKLEGRWEVKEAFRNEKQTEMLQGLFFDFQPEGQLLSNLTGMEEKSTYALDGKFIQQRGGAIEADYKIETLEDTILVVTTTIRDKRFKMIFGKAAAE